MATSTIRTADIAVQEAEEQVKFDLPLNSSDIIATCNDAQALRDAYVEYDRIVSTPRVKQAAKFKTLISKRLRDGLGFNKAGNYELDGGGVITVTGGSVERKLILATLQELYPEAYNDERVWSKTKTAIAVKPS